MTSAHHRHQDSLEGFLDFSSNRELSPEVRSQAETRFHAIVEHFRNKQSRSTDDYDRVALVHHTYEYARTEKSKQNLLQAFFKSMALPLTDTEDFDLSSEESERELSFKLTGFADYLLENFFLPCER